MIASRISFRAPHAAISTPQHLSPSKLKSAPGKVPTDPPLTDDDGRALWASPTDGQPLDLAYLPPGSQLIVALRPRSLAEHPEGEKVRAALGPLGDRAIKHIEEVSNAKWQEIERLVVGFQSTSSNGWKPTVVAHFASAAPQTMEDELRGAPEKRHGAEAFLIAGDRAYWFPVRHNRRVLVIAPVDAIGDILDLGGEAPPLRRDMERLLTHTDADRHLTIVVAPNALFSEGGRIFHAEMVRLRDPLFWFLGDELSAAVVSLHWDENFFVELLVSPTLDTSAEGAARILMERLDQVPLFVEQFVESLRPQYGRAVVERFPQMIRQLVANNRSGFGADHALLRCYLPVVAGHNLLMGAELTLAMQPGAGSPVANAAAPLVSEVADGASARDRLKRVTSLRFSRDTLEAALHQLAADIGVPIVVRGADLQAEGITKNQSFGIDVAHRPAEEILVAILTLANPDKSAEGPADERHKLVYVISSGGLDGSEQIVVTTRAAVLARGDELPPVFTRKQP